MRHKWLLLGGALACLFITLPAHAKRAHQTERSTAFDDKIAELAKVHKVPERLIHRVIMRESRYNPKAVSKGNFGLMQIRLGTAQTMGYTGTAMGLTNGITNLTFAVPYLANAYAIAGQDEDARCDLYAAGFYYHAKRQGMLGRLQTGKGGAAPDDDAVVAYAPPPQVNPIAALFGALTAPAQAAVDAAQAESAAARAQFAANGEAVADDGETDVPLPPRRPHVYSTRKFLQLAMKQDPIDGELRGSEAE